MCTDNHKLGTNYSSDNCLFDKQNLQNFSFITIIINSCFDNLDFDIKMLKNRCSINTKDLSLSAINSNKVVYNDLHVTQSYNTVLAVLGQNAVCQPDRNFPGTPIYCDQTTTRFSVTATSSSSTVYAVQVNQGSSISMSLFLFLILSFFLLVSKQLM